MKKQQLCSRCKRELDWEKYKLLETASRVELIKIIKDLDYHLTKLKETKQ